MKRKLNVNDPEVLERVKVDTVLQNQLLEENKGLIWHCALNYQSTGIETDELFQLASIGFIKALSKFDPSKSKFNTYAYPSMVNEILMYFRQTKKHSNNLYLEEVVHHDEKSPITLGETLPGTDNTEEKAIDNIVTAQLIDGLDYLNSKDSVFVELRVKGFRQEKIARILGYSQSYVSRRLKVVLNLLKGGQRMPIRQVKCPKCGALGNKLKNVKFLNCCTNCSEEGLFYDDKQQVYRYDKNGKLRKIGMSGVIEEPSKEDLIGLSAKQISNTYGVCLRTALYWQAQHGLFASAEEPAEKPAGEPVTAEEPKNEPIKEETTDMRGGKMTKLPVPEKPAIEKLIVKHHGKIDVMAKASGVSWHVMNKWVKHYGLQKMAKKETEKFHIRNRTEKKIKVDVFKKLVQEGQTKENIAKFFGLKMSEVQFWIEELQQASPDNGQTQGERGVTPEEPAKPVLPPLDNVTVQATPWPQAIPGAIIYNHFTGKRQDFPSISEAVSYMEENCSKREAQQIELMEVKFKKVPFSFGVNVIPGEVS